MKGEIMRYRVVFDDDIAIIETDNRDEAIKYAQFNAGAAFDTETWLYIADYR